MLGGSGADVLIGTDAAERLEGNGGADSLIGNGGNDTLNGGAGNDALVGGAGVDTFNGGDGVDRIDARDGAADGAIVCGNARDLLADDAADVTPADCEVVAPLLAGSIAVAGEARIGATLSAVFSGSVGGTESALAWRWLRCGVAGCVAAGDGASYAVSDADAGAQVVAVLHAANEAGTGSSRPRHSARSHRRSSPRRRPRPRPLPQRRRAPACARSAARAAAVASR